MLHVRCYILGKFRKQSSQQRSSLLEAIMISVDNLDENLKKRYKQLAVFLDDSSVPKKVNICMCILIFTTNYCYKFSIEYQHYIKYYHTFGIQFRRRIPIVKSMDAKSMGAATLERKNDIKIGGKFDSDSNGDMYRHKNYRQIFLPLQVNYRNVYKQILFHI